MSERLNPEISVVVLTRNRYQLLPFCLRSLADQDFPKSKFEIIICDDGSTDATPETVSSWLKKYPSWKYFYQPESGVSAARNLGIRQAVGTMVAIVADDYVIPPNYLRRVCSFFKEHPEASAVRFHIKGSGRTAFEKAADLHREIYFRARLRIRSAEDFAWRRLIRYDFKGDGEQILPVTSPFLEAAGGCAFKKDIFLKVGLFNEHLRRYEDADFANRMRSMGLQVFYDSTIEILHREFTNPSKTLQKYFEIGYWQQKCTEDTESETESCTSRTERQPFAIRCKNLFGNYFLKPLWIAKCSGSISKTFVYFPFILLIELTIGLGQRRARSELKKSGGI